jgi:hypothetical protein
MRPGRWCAPAAPHPRTNPPDRRGSDRAGGYTAVPRRGPTPGVLHDEASERARLLDAAIVVLAQRLAGVEAVATRAGTIQRAERPHQLDPTSATGLGSLRIQETYRVDPNDLRSLPAGVACIVTDGRAAKTAMTSGPGYGIANNAPGGSPRAFRCPRRRRSPPGSHDPRCKLRDPHGHPAPRCRGLAG